MIWWKDEIPPSWLLRSACLQAAWPAVCRWAHSMEVLLEFQGRFFCFLNYSNLSCKEWNRGQKLRKKISCVSFISILVCACWVCLCTVCVHVYAHMLVHNHFGLFRAMVYNQWCLWPYIERKEQIWERQSSFSHSFIYRIFIECPSSARYSNRQLQCQQHRQNPCSQESYILLGIEEQKISK